MVDHSTASTCVAARFSALPGLLVLLAPEATVSGAESRSQTLLRAQLAVEELFANSIHHGYGQESDNPVWLSVACDAAVLRVTYADAAGEFDPFATLVPMSSIPEAKLEERHVGGLGRLLVRELAQRCEYRRDNGRNVTELEFELTPAADQDRP